MKINRVALGLTLVICIVLLPACGRDYIISGRAIAAEASLRLKAGIRELTRKALPTQGTPIANATVKLLPDCNREGKPLKETSPWRTVTTDQDGRFQIRLYGPATGKLRAALQVEAANFTSEFATYWDEMDPDEQIFLVVLSAV